MDETKLTEAFPEFNIEFLPGISNPHGYAAASRICEYQWVINCLPIRFDNAKFERTEEDNVRATVVDIGGKLELHIKRGRRGIHVCSPILDRKDNLRATNLLIEAKRYEAIDRHKARYYTEVFANRDTIVI